MNSTELLARFRLDTRDTGHPQLWSDDEIYSYLDDAQKMFCRLTGGLADATSSACARLKAKSGVSYAALSPRVLKVRAAFGADGKKLDIVNFEDLEFSSTSGEELFAGTTGTVTTVIVGMEPNKVKLINTPDADQTINLIVYRLPLDDITESGMDLEIDEQHHLALLKWAQRLAHMKTDAETYDRGRADQFELEFRNYCEQARDERGRREHKHRLMAFSW
jgi:hypothetical protein